MGRLFNKFGHISLVLSLNAIKSELQIIFNEFFLYLIETFGKGGPIVLWKLSEFGQNINIDFQNIIWPRSSTVPTGK